MTAPNDFAGWDITLLGGLLARRGTQAIGNFGSRAAAALLARLALYPQREHPREELIEHLWPGVELDVGRNRLRQTLFALRRVLEADADAAGTAPLLLADRHGLRVADGALRCDARRFEAAVHAGHHAEAHALYAGELLPGFYDGWIEDERLRFAALFDRVEAALAARPPAAVAVPAGAALPPSLPTYLTRFFGRDADGARLRAEVLAHRLVTLLGPGGSGKTRLAVELAASLSPAGSQGAAPCFDQVIFAPLVDCTAQASLLDALLAAANLKAPGSDALQTLLNGLGGRRVLLVLDNVEQLGVHAQQAALQLLGALPALHLLVTSRHVLGLDGEREFSVAPLPLPYAGMPLDRLAINPSVALFIDRAHAARAGFHLDAANRDSVVALVCELEGMPLALELAATRLRSLSCADMLALLRPDATTAATAAGTAPAQPRLELLSRPGPRGGADARHASMLRVIEWSWEQLEPAPAELLCALTVFEGGFSASAVRTVFAGLQTNLRTNLQTQAEPLRLLDELVAHSLVHVSVAAEPDLLAEPGDGAAAPASHWRYGIYEPIREFAASRLATALALSLRSRHRAWLTGWAGTLGHAVPIGALRGEMRNLLAALRSALDDGAPADALRLLLSLGLRAEDSGLTAQAVAMLELALQRVDDAVLASRAHSALGRLCFVAGMGEVARRHVDIGLRSAPAEAAWRARALLAHVAVHWRSTRDAEGCEAQLDEAEALALQCGDIDLQASVHAQRAHIRTLATRDVAGGRVLHERAVALWQRCGNSHAVNRGHYNLAVNDWHAGHHADALQRLPQVVAQARAERNWQQLSKALNLQGNALSELRRWPEAMLAYRDCLRVAWAAAEYHELAYGMWNIPLALARMRRPDAAARLSAFAARYWESRFGSLSGSDLRDLRRNRRMAAVQIGHAAADAQWQHGERMTLADAVALALALDPGADAAASAAGVAATAAAAAARAAEAQRRAKAEAEAEAVATAGGAGPSLPSSSA